MNNAMKLPNSSIKLAWMLKPSISPPTPAPRITAPWHKSPEPKRLLEFQFLNPGRSPLKSRQRRISRPDRLKPTSAARPRETVKSAAGVHRQAISLPALPTPDVAHNKYDFPRPFRMGCAHAGAPTPRG